jgi:hypothetical protein
VPWQAPIMAFLKRYGWKALVWLVRLFGAEEVFRFVWRWLQKVTGLHPDRRRSIRKAKEVDGKFGSALLSDRVHWVVFKGDRPVAEFPKFDGDLAAELRDYRRDQLVSPDALPSRRAQAQFKERFSRLLRRGEGVPNGEGERPPAGAEDFQQVIDQLEPLLERLTSSPRAPLAEHATIPKAPGIYLFSEGPNPIYVGQTRNLQQRLRQHMSPSSKENSAPFAFNLAMTEARKDPGIDTHGTRKEIAARPEFDAVFRKARERVAGMNVQVIELDDPVTRTIFEVYAARVLGTDEFNVWETH